MAGTDASSLSASLGEYARFLDARDGPPDPDRRLLPRREEFMEWLELHPVRSRFVLGEERLLRNLSRRRSDPDLDLRIGWLLAAAKSSQGESYATDLVERGIDLRTLDAVRLHMHLQETYHTRMLAEIFAIFGLPNRVPPLEGFLRTVIRSGLMAPGNCVMPFIGASEMVGCVLFRTLAERAIDVFRDEPEVGQRLRLVLREILRDEIGHVGYHAATLGPVGRRVMRRLCCPLGMLIIHQSSAAELLLGRQAMREGFRAFSLERLLAECDPPAYAARLI
jgi:hypothetical protein